MKKSKMKTLLMSALALSGIGTTLATSTVNADNVTKANTVTDHTKINTVDMVAQQMRNQGLNPDHIKGQYVVRQGDTLSAISAAAHESMNKIAQNNHITNLDEIYVGQILDLSYESTDIMKANVTKVAGIGGTGDKVAKASRTKAQVEATAMVNQGAKAMDVVAAINNAKPSTGGDQGSATTPSNPNQGSTGNVDKPADKPSTGGDQGSATTPSNPNQGSTGNVDKPADKPSTGGDQGSATTPSNPNQGSTGNVDKPADKPSTGGDQGSATTPSNPDQGSDTGNIDKPANKPSTGGDQGGTTTPSNPDQGSDTGNVDKPADKPSTGGDQGSTTTPSNPDQGSDTGNVDKPADKPSTGGDQGGTTTPSNPDQGTETDYEKGVVNSDGTVNYDTAMNQKGPWDSKSTQTNEWGESEASKAWEQAHPNANMSGQSYADGSTSQVPDYGGNDPYYANQRTPEGYTQDQLDQANQEMQKNINASETFGNGIQWVSSDYQGEQTGSQDINIDNPVNTPYENTAQHVGQIDANVVKQDYNGNNNFGYQLTVPEGSKYVSSSISNAANGAGGDGLPANTVHLNFYK